MSPSRRIARMGKPEYDSYWQFIHHLPTSGYPSWDILRKAGITYGSQSARRMFDNADQVIAMRLRYDHASIPETQLKRFIRDRGLSMPQHPDRLSMVKVLCDADVDPSFDRFQDLPPELRHRIYQLHLSEFPGLLECPTQPPLARTCRQLRDEVLPVFYASKTFLITLVDVRYHWRDVRCSGYHRRPKLRFDDQTSAFLHSIPAGADGHLRKFQLALKRVVRGYSGELVQIRAKLSIDAAQKEGRRVVEILKGSRRKPRGAALQVSLSQAMDEICRQHDGRRVRVDDVSKLRSVAELTYFVGDKSHKAQS